MKDSKCTNPTIFFLIILIIGCASPAFKGQIKPEDETTVFVDEVTETRVFSDTSYPYENEEALLEEILYNYDEALIAHQNGNYGLAETKIDDALVLSQQVNLDEIMDESLLLRFKDAIFLIAQELGKILNESSIIAEEDPMAWLEELNAEQFKSGKWTDEELEKIVMKIAVTADVPIEFNKQVRNAIYYFQNGGKEDMAKWMKRSGRYIPLLRKILSEEGIPVDMVYLSMIESGFSTKAYSRARAVGLWQFIYSTGKIYGLNRNQWIDERRDPVKSTKAAAKHLNDLYKESDDWNNVMAMYNSGPRRIRLQMKNTENIEFWDLQLPRETKNYVPSFMAAVVISKAPEIFGFDNIEKDPPFEYDTVEVHPYTSLTIAAKCSGVDITEIRELNPEILRDRVPPGENKYTLRIPKGSKDTFLAEYTKAPVEKYEPPRLSSVRVRRGDTFSGIADRHRVSISRLRAANPHITNINRLRINQTINIPGTTTQSPNYQTIPVSRDDAFVYTIKKNDTLGILAERYTTTVQTLQSLNNMGRGTRIYVGQKLLIPQNKDSSPSKQLQITDVGKAKIVYIVQKNDTIYEIAQRYGVDYRKIKEINKIKDHRKIQPGQKLIIEK
ncbi:LysM peptidoglycan-binding domain-containing protein [Candidatus Latescibacterota bacterium]